MANRQPLAISSGELRQIDDENDLMLSHGPLVKQSIPDGITVTVPDGYSFIQLSRYSVLGSGRLEILGTGRAGII